MQAQDKVLPANRLKQLRDSRNWKLYDVSHHVRVDPATVYRWEAGDSNIPDETKFALAVLFGVSVPHLMGWDDEATAA